MDSRRVYDPETTREGLVGNLLPNFPETDPIGGILHNLTTFSLTTKKVMKVTVSRVNENVVELSFRLFKDDNTLETLKIKG